jgi:transposase
MIPAVSGYQAWDMLQAQTEIPRLKAQLKRTGDKRDTLKKAARYFAREPN